LFNEKENLYIYFMDVEGTESVDNNSNYDAKLFTLSILISSIFIFNSVGVIDELSI